MGKGESVPQTTAASSHGHVPFPDGVDMWCLTIMHIINKLFIDADGLT